MKQQFISARAAWLAAAVLAGGFAGAARAADIQEDPAAALRLSQKSARSCTDGCMADCRAERTDCKQAKTDDDTNNNCPARFQICVRRCVVSCSPK